MLTSAARSGLFATPWSSCLNAETVIWRSGTRDACPCLAATPTSPVSTRPSVAARTNQYGDAIELTGTGLLARCFQHETDHLAGMVFGDRLSSRRCRGLYESHRKVADQYPYDWPVSTLVGW